MTALGAAVRCELLKARRSKVPRVATLALSLAPLMAALFMVIMKDPVRARRWGLVTAKAMIFAGTADWPTYVELLAQSVAVGGWIVFSIVTAWAYGREFADRTAKTVLAVPTPRWATVLAKLLVVAGICAVMTAWVLVLALGIGAVIGLPGGGGRVILDGILATVAAAGLTITLLPVVAFAASAGRGYAVPFAAAIFLLFLAQITAALGWGDWFPWAVPALMTGAAGPGGPVPTPWSYAGVVAAGAVGLALTLAWWHRTDHVR